MGEFWKKLSVPSKFKANSTNTYKKKPPVYNWTCGINKMR